MKKIEAIIRPQMVESVKSALAKVGVTGMTLSQVSGCGNQKGFVEHFRVSDVYIALLPKVEIKIIVRDDQVQQIVQALMQSARTGEIGDGKIFVSAIEDVYRIRTGEEGEQAV